MFYRSERKKEGEAGEVIYGGLMKTNVFPGGDSKS